MKLKQLLMLYSLYWLVRNFVCVGNLTFSGTIRRRVTEQQKQ